MIHSTGLRSFFCHDAPAFFERKFQKCIDLVSRIFFHLRTFWNKKEREEYRLFSEVKSLSSVEVTPEISRLFKEKINALCQKFSDEDITNHIKRLNHGRLGYLAYFDPLTGIEEKAVIKAHEVFEMLAMKWESGVPFDRDRFSVFWSAHTKAIKVENTFFQILALEKGLILSRDALKYCRIYDDIYLTYPIQFTSFEMNLEHTHDILTKKSDRIPNRGQEIDNFCTFFSQLMGKKWNPRNRTGLCQRYLYSRLHNNYPDKKVRLIALLRALEGDNVYNCPVDVILGQLKDHLTKYRPSFKETDEGLLKEDHFFNKDPQHIPWEISQRYKDLVQSFRTVP